MPPRKPRGVKSAAPSPSPARATRSRSAVSAVSQPDEDVGSVATQPTVPEDDEDEADDDDEGSNGGDDDEGGEGGEDGVEEEDAGDDAGEEESAGAAGAKPSREERMAKLKQLRMRMNETAAANRRDLVADHQKSRVTARELQRLEKQRKLAQTLRLKADADASGEDLERRKAWEWSIEQNERWEKKQNESKERSDQWYNHDNDVAHRKYDKNVRTTKPDLVGYARQKEAALGLEAGSLVPLNATNDSLAAAGPSRATGLSAAEDLYRSADTLRYGDSKPSEDAIDRVVGKINKEIAGTGRKRHRKDDDGDVTYINNQNKVFNSKVARYFDKYTKDIRANLERGTAL